MPQQRRFVPDRLPEAAAPNLPDDRRAAVLPDHELDDVVFTGCNLVRADFTNADLSRARFVDCQLTAAQFTHATLTGTRFTRCELVDIDGVTSMRGAVVEGHNLVALAHTLATALGITIDAED